MGDDPGRLERRHDCQHDRADDGSDVPGAGTHAKRPAHNAGKRDCRGAAGANPGHQPDDDPMKQALSIFAELLPACGGRSRASKTSAFPSWSLGTRKLLPRRIGGFTLLEVMIAAV